MKKFTSISTKKIEIFDLTYVVETYQFENFYFKKYYLNNKLHTQLGSGKHAIETSWGDFQDYNFGTPGTIAIYDSSHDKYNSFWYAHPHRSEVL